MFKTIKENVSAEIVEKKSKFIANIFYVESAEEADKTIRKLKKKYYDSRHNCFAYRIFSQNGIIQKFSDDGEPSGTAGGPILNILETKNLCNILVVVTRYFGGILLGTGGLVRSYSLATTEALNKSNIIDKEFGVKISIEVGYSDLEKLKYYLSCNEMKIVSSEYLENIKIIVDTTKEKFIKLQENESELNFRIIKLECISEIYVDS